ncbi:hypothetical protein [Emcibacter sp.]|uniref:hypothetical protein n=1 Tax=Emcibacter sp. TaxID=1979954 RepID=UPI003A90A342
MTTPRRILLGFATGEECRSVLETALGMARETEAELVAILARDETLTAASGIPCVSVRSLAYSRWEQIDEGVMKRAFAAEAVRLETLIASGAQARNVRWSFRTASPERVQEDWGETDILLLPRSLRLDQDTPAEARSETGPLTRYILRLERIGYRVILKPSTTGNNPGS